MTNAQFLGYLFLLWLSYQFGVAVERSKNDKKEAERMFYQLLENIEEGKSGFRSVEDAWRNWGLSGIETGMNKTQERVFRDLLQAEVKKNKAIN